MDLVSEAMRGINPFDLCRSVNQNWSKKPTRWFISGNKNLYDLFLFMRERHDFDGKNKFEPTSCISCFDNPFTPESVVDYASK